MPDKSISVPVECKRVFHFIKRCECKFKLKHNWNCGYKRTAPGWLEKRSLARPLRISAKISTSIIRDVAKNVMKLQLVTALQYLTSNLDKNWFSRLRTNAADPSLEHINSIQVYNTYLKTCLHACSSFEQLSHLIMALSLQETRDQYTAIISYYPTSRSIHCNSN